MVQGPQLRTAYVKRSAASSGSGPTGPTGPAGPTGPTGPQGPAGSNAFRQFLYGGALANGDVITTAPFDANAGAGVIGGILSGTSNGSLSIQRQVATLAAPTNSDFSNSGSAITGVNNNGLYSFSSGAFNTTARWQRFVITASANVARADIWVDWS